MGQRFLNRLIDWVVVQALIFCIAFFTTIAGLRFFQSLGTWETVGVAYLINFLYYVTFESASGLTLGKLVTGTRVFALDGSKLSGTAVLIRSACRCIPFEALSIFFADGMWHDNIPKAKVVKVRGKDAMLPDMPVGRSPVRPPMPGQPLPAGVVPGPARPGMPDRPPAPPQPVRPPVNPQ